MKKVKVQDAVGLTLCHDITAMRDGFKGAAFKRGHVIEEGDVEKLLDLGKRTVFIWEENAGEIHEEDAARRMAAMAQVPGCHYTEPSEGKVLLMADQCGMFRVDTNLLNKVNSIGDLTISTLPDHFPVEAGDRLASMRIVPLVTQETQILEAERLCQGRTLLDLRPYRARKAGVIITGSEIYTGRIQDKFEPVVRAKLAHYPGEILGVAERYLLPGAQGSVGLIRPVSHQFCGSCDRLRLTADGKLKPCLHSSREFSIRGLDDDAMLAQFERAIREKPAAHAPLTLAHQSESGRSMNEIGG